MHVLAKSIEQFEFGFWYLAYNLQNSGFDRMYTPLREIKTERIERKSKNKIRFLVDDLEDYLSCDASNISDMIGFKMFSFRELVLEYGPDHMSTVKVLWNASQQKFNLIFGGKCFFFFFY